MTSGVLGPVEVIGWIHAPDRAIVTELACYLALHPGRVIPGDELGAALWPDAAREASAKSLHTYMSLLRKALGTEHVPVGSGSGYRIGDEVTTDWLRFRDLTGPRASPDQLENGLELIRGRPFAGAPPTSFGWVFSELLVSEIEVAVVDVTRRLIEAHSAIGDLAGASWTVRRGLLAVPTDFGLWGLRLALADRQGRDELTRPAVTPRRPSERTPPISFTRWLLMGGTDYPVQSVSASSPSWEERWSVPGLGRIN